MTTIIIRALGSRIQKIIDDVRKKRNQRLMMSYVLKTKPIKRY